MRIEYERIDFAKGTATKVVREIDAKDVLKGNALFQKLSREPKPKPEVK